jgi:hypothetical protein
MSPRRQSQWAQRLSHLQALRERFALNGHYNRALRAHLVVQRVYDRWADEVFSGQR